MLVALTNGYETLNATMVRGSIIFIVTEKSKKQNLTAMFAHISGQDFGITGYAHKTTNN